MSARAAWRLEQLGFTDVYDYSLGRTDWETAGLPMEGIDVRGPVVADATTHDPPTAKVDETVGTARQRLDSDTQVIVNNEENVVVGVMRKESWDESDDVPVGEAMRLGPGTVRPGSHLEPLVGRMERKDVESVIVTDPEGRLVGVLTAKAGQDALEGRVESFFEECNSCPGWWHYRVKTA
ncbi:MAG: CBS domain-containing protein [Actinomycetota bacterium]